MTIARTFGTAGSDYATFSDIWNARVAAGALADTEVWTNEGSHTCIVDALGSMLLAGHDLTIDFGKDSGYVISATAQLLMDLESENIGDFTAKNGVFEDNGVGVGKIVFRINIIPAAPVAHVLPRVFAKNISVAAVSGVNALYGIVLSPNVSDTGPAFQGMRDWFIFNMIATGFRRNFLISGSSAAGDERDLYVENCASFNSAGFAILNDYGISIAGPWQVKDCYSCHDNASTAVDWNNATPADAPTMYNCASSDGTVFGQDTYDPIVAADEFKSTTYGDSDFLKLTGEGQRIAKATAEPATGEAPLEVQFAAGIESVFSGGGVLGTGGTTPSIADNTTDFEGKARPTAGGTVAIGCYEPDFTCADVVV